MEFFSSASVGAVATIFGDAGDVASAAYRLTSFVH